MDNKVNFLRGTATEYEASTKDNDTFYYTTDDEKLYLGNKEITGGGVTIDDTLSDTSEHPVQNKVINAALNSKADLSDIPTSLPANGGNADIAKYIGTWGGAEEYYGEQLKMRVLFNKFGDFRFGLTTDTDNEIRVDYATNADTLGGKPASDFADNIYKGYPKEGNCNNATAQGVYTVSSNSTNAPNTDYYTLTVDVAGDGTWIVQTAISASTESVAYRRTCINGNWGTWRSIADGGNANTANTAGTLATTASNICLRNLSSGTAAANTTNCPSGAWYGQHS